MINDHYDRERDSLLIKCDTGILICPWLTIDAKRRRFVALSPGKASPLACRAKKCRSGDAHCELRNKTRGGGALLWHPRDIKHNNNDSSPHRHKYCQCNEFIPYLGAAHSSSFASLEACEWNYTGIVAADGMRRWWPRIHHRGQDMWCDSQVSMYELKA